MKTREGGERGEGERRREGREGEGEKGRGGRSFTAILLVFQKYLLQYEENGYLKKFKSYKFDEKY